MAAETYEGVWAMPAADTSFSWQAALLAYLIVAVAAFLVTFVGTDLLHLRRPAYVGVLAALVVGLGVWHLAWSGTSFTELAGSNIAWGIAAGILAAVAVAPLIRRLPAGAVPDGIQRVEQVAWEDVVYGTAEALLLAVYPVLTLWHATAAGGWTQSGVGKFTAAAVAVGGSLLVIFVHHVGYVEFRTRSARPKVVGALFSCGLQALAYVVTGTLIAPVAAHIALHVQLTMHGVEMPPVDAVEAPAHG